jgi:hypothetical protein
MLVEALSTKCVLLISLISLFTVAACPFIVEKGCAYVAPHESSFSTGGGSFCIRYGNTSFAIDSNSEHGNFSFSFMWENSGLFIEFNGSVHEMKELKQISLWDKTANYMIELWAPRLLYEYIDVNEDNLFTGCSNEPNFVISGPDILLSSYKININIGMTNITITENANGQLVCEWTYIQLAMPMKANVQGPWEKYPIIKEFFHYYPINGTLKMDIILENFKPKDKSSKVLITYGVQFIRLEPGNSTVTFDRYEFTPAQIEKVYPVNSTTIKFKVNNVERAMFDFGGNVTIDGLTGFKVRGSIGPPDLYWLSEKNDWITIGLNYPHINTSMEHDPYFGLIFPTLTAPASAMSHLAIVTAIISTAILIAVIYDYRKTKRCFANRAIVTCRFS